jgi:hypothetical protein
MEDIPCFGNPIGNQDSTITRRVLSLILFVRISVIVVPLALANNILYDFVTRDV